MAKTGEKRKQAGEGGWVYRSAENGRVVSHAATKEEAVARARFLAVASLSAIPKKSKLTQAQAKRAVQKLFEGSTVRDAGT